MASKKINKKEVYSADDLKLYLKQQATKNKRLYHYTTYESLLAIIKNKSFRLSRMDLMNDKAEQSIGLHDINMQSYIMSFTQEKEYVSMWAMYGKSSGIKLRVDFPSEAFIDYIDGYYFDFNKYNKIPFRKIKPLFGEYDSPVQFSDIVYIDKQSNSLNHNTKPFQNLIFDEEVKRKLTGFIKYNAWEFEKETRLKIKLNKSYINIDNEFPEHIYVDINDKLINQFHITFNPWLPKIMKDEIKRSLNSLSGFDLQYSNSDNDGEISEI